MAFCLTKQASDKFKKALKEGELDPFKLSGMDSLARRALMAKYVGNENAVEVNALFESKLLLKNQQKGFISWAKKTSGITPQVKRDLISRIEKMDKVLNPKEQEQFLQDLASTKLGIDITENEAKTISDFSQEVARLREKANKDGVFSSEKDRLEYGLTKVRYEAYIKDLKLQARNISFREQPVQKVKELIGNIPGTMKSLVASLDNSFWGRQGIKTLLDVRTSHIWFKNFLKSWGDIGKELVGKDAMEAIRADIYSRPNALNGKYDAGNYGLTVLSEEAFPSSVPEKIPLLGRLFKASESAYNGAALRLRADLADRFIKMAEKQGINTLDKTQAEGIGQLVSSMTGRGSNYLNLTGEQQKKANVLFFSIKFLQSNIDTLTAHLLNKKATAFTKKEAAKNLLGIVTSVASILTMAKLLDSDSVDPDPRSTKFGKVKVFGNWVDITGGMASLVTLASRLTPTKHDGVWGLWTKSSQGNWTNLTSGEYGQQNALDVFNNFWEGKLSPIAGLVRDLWKGKNYDGEPVTVKSALGSLTIPFSAQNYENIKNNKNSSFILGSMIIDGLGLSTSSYVYETNWNTSKSKEMIQFKNTVGEEKFKQANEDYNKAYSDWFNATSQNPDYLQLSEESRSSLITKAKDDIKNQIFKNYGFKYKKESKTKESIKEDDTIKKLQPK